MPHNRRLRSPRPRLLLCLWIGLVVLPGVCAGCQGGESSPPVASAAPPAREAAPPPREEVVVFAAASLTDALEVLTDSFRTASPGYEVVLNVSASSLLAYQIDQGATADVFFSDDEGWVAFLEQRGHVGGPVRTPLSNRIVVAGSNEAEPLSGPEVLTEVNQIAMADPNQAPAGMYAKRALECSGLWSEVQPKIRPTLDVRGALRATHTRGPLDVSMVYHSDVLADTAAKELLMWPEACQPQIRYAVARLTDARTTRGAEAWIRYVTAPERDAFWRSMGFEPLRTKTSSASD